ncbi:hypothetical protein [Marinobacter sp. F3R08]|uniref:hypothetical protein n=1 Tax=Marinobacter sp. F3R08 TaxID=2841559 RepID=UPI001C09569B|nr:hypothetical protein [Marinobacter sp. F3R08]MBU2952829.1 hypothetical protein [Marinobacter sp. F3R08]
MSDEAGSVSKKFRTHALVELALMVALGLYLLAAQDQVVGENLAFTMTGAALMALATYWTLNTLRDGLEVIALRTRQFRH